MTFQNPDHAFSLAISLGRLSSDKSAPNFAGKYMYMGTNDQDQDLFKNIETRAYLPIEPPTPEPEQAQQLTRIFCQTTGIYHYIPINGGTQHNSKKLSIPEIQKNHPNVFDCNFYDTILEGIKLLFGDNNVSVNHKTNTITIKDRINLTLHISWNESKIYFDTFIFRVNLKEKTEIEEYCKIQGQNYSFRLFGLDQIFEYLYIKRDENEFIKNNEG